MNTWRTFRFQYDTMSELVDQTFYGTFAIIYICCGDLQNGIDSDCFLFRVVIKHQFHYRIGAGYIDVNGIILYAVMYKQWVWEMNV